LQERLNDRGPELVPLGVEVKAVFEEQILPWRAVLSEHGLIDVDIGDCFVGLTEGIDQLVGLLHFVAEVPAGEARFDGEERDPGLRQVSVDEAGEFDEVLEHLLG